MDNEYIINVISDMLFTIVVQQASVANFLNWTNKVPGVVFFYDLISYSPHFYTNKDIDMRLCLADTD